MKRANLMRKSAVLGLGLVLLLALSVGAYAVSFSDISGHWAESYINWWADQGYIQGYPDGTFKPDNEITRAELMVMINRCHNYSEPTSINFRDVLPSDWFYNDVAIAVNAGYIVGYPDRTMQPNKPLTRQEMAVVIAKLAGLSPDASAADKFTDAKSIPAWSKEAIGALAKIGIINGYPGGSFDATKTITRAEAVVMLLNYTDYIGLTASGLTNFSTSTNPPKPPVQPTSSGTTSSGTVTPTTPPTGGGSGGGGGGGGGGAKYLADLLVYTNVDGGWENLTNNTKARSASYTFNEDTYNNNQELNDVKIRITSLGQNRPSTVNLKAGSMISNEIQTETSYSVNELFNLAELYAAIDLYMLQYPEGSRWTEAANAFKSGMDAMNTASSAAEYAAARDLVFNNSNVVAMFNDPTISRYMKELYGITATIGSSQITSMSMEFVLTKTGYRDMTLSVTYN